MQLMPATARYVARKMNVPDFTPARVNELEMNLQLGTGIPEDGARRPRWFIRCSPRPRTTRGPGDRAPGGPRSSRPVEGAIFAETIPFNETRDYVKKVMSNSVYYAALSENKAQSLKARLGAIAPKAAGTTELP